MGADDYITKPFSPRELVARIRAVLRRTREAPEREKIITIGDLTINTDTYQVMKRGRSIQLSATEFRLLLYLVQKKGRVFNRDMLLDAVWKDEAFVEPRTVDVHIRRLRSRIEDDPAHPEYIKTRRGIGYYVDGEL
jgi:DNA-binding response OmpR family regulator